MSASVKASGGASVNVDKYLFGYPAGKARLSSQLVPLIPEHDVYTESFCGSAAIFFDKKRARVEALNDRDPEVAQALRSVRSLTKIEFASLGRFDWVGSRYTFDKLKKSKPSGRVEILYRFLYMSRLSFRKGRKSFAPDSEGFDAKKGILSRLEKSRSRMHRGVKIFSGDYEKVVREFDGPNAFHFLDPPYPGYDAGVGEKEFDEVRFRKLLDSIKGKFLVTYGVRGKLDLNGFKVRKISPNRYLARETGNKGPEKLETLLISNYDYKMAALDLGDRWAEEITISDDSANDLADLGAITRETAVWLSTFVKKCAKYSKSGSVRELAKSIEPLKPLGETLAGFGDRPKPSVSHNPERAASELLSAIDATIGDSTASILKDHGEAAKDGLRRFLSTIYVIGELDHGDTQVNLGKISISKSISDLSSALKSLGDDEIISKRSDMLSLFSGNFAGNKLTFNGGMLRLDLIKAELLIKDEMSRRGISVQEHDALSREAKRVAQSKSGEPQGGAHVHRLDRKAKRTDGDGVHRHIFLMKDGSFLSTEGDGAHWHAIGDESSNMSETDGAHTHKVRLSDGSIVETVRVSGVHSHELQFDSTVFDGLHQHKIELAGQVIESMTPGEFFTSQTKSTFLEDVESKSIGSGSTSKDQDVIASKRELTTQERNDFPDSSFLYVAPGGDQDGEGKTVPRALRMFPVRDKDGLVLLPQLRNALARIPQSDLDSDLKNTLMLRARRMLDEITKRETAIACDDPTFDLPSEERKLDGSLQYHFNNRSMHADFRINVGGHLIGWTFKFARRGAILKKIETIKDALSIAESFSFDGNRYAHSMREPSSIAATPKLRHPISWISSATKVFDEFEPGATATSKGILAQAFRVNVELGVQSDSLHEYFLSGDNVCGLLAIRKVDDEWRASIMSSSLPHALHPGATLPPSGKSSLPLSLRKDVPPEFRYWLTIGPIAKRMHSALIASKTLTDSTVRIVGGDFRRVVHKIFLDPMGDTKAEPLTWISQVEKLIDRGSMVESFGTLRAQKKSIAFFDAGCGNVSSVVDSAASLNGPYVITAKDSMDARDCFSTIGEVFKFIPNRSTAFDDIDRVFVSSLPLAKTSCVEFLHHSAKVEKDRNDEIDPDVIRDPFIKSLLSRRIPLIKTKDEHFVLGVVLEPEVRDAQGDIYSADEVRIAAHSFMEQFQNIGFMHRELINDKVSILESYVAPETFTISDQTVKKGTWLFATRINDPPMWEGIKDGSLGGYSIGGSAVRVPDGDKEKDEQA